MHTPVTTRATPATAPAASHQPASRQRAAPAGDQPLRASACGIDSNEDSGAAAKAQATDPAGAETCALTVLYDGGCPLCRREIALYRELPAREAVHYLDISTASAAQLPAGAAREASKSGIKRNCRVESTCGEYSVFSIHNGMRMSA
jgi:hypothetical protein